MREWKLQEWKKQEKIADVENAGVENTGVKTYGKPSIQKSLTVEARVRIRGAGSKLKVGGAQIPARSAGKIFFCAPHFSAVPPSLRGTAHTRVGTNMCNHIVGA